jgi:uncharacterized protein YkwD
MKKFLLIVLIFSLNYFNGISATKYSHGTPTNEEQFILELINRARANPQEEAQRVINYSDSYVQSEINKIGKTLIVSQFSTYPKRPPLAFNAQINVAAKVHSQDMSNKDYQDHTGSDGSSPFDRMNKAGYTGWQGAGENIFAASQGPEYAHISFLVDWGAENQAKLGHRQNILNYTGTVFTEVGISGLVAPRKSATGPYVCTEDFGLKSERFVLGVVYNDKNGNKFYDPGEGLPDVLITLSSGNYEALTSSSGGYAIPINNLGGSITIKAEGNGLGGIITQNFSVSGENVKVDFTSALAGAVSLETPKNLIQIDSTNINFKWYKSNKATSYLFELADDQDFLGTIVSKVITDTTISPDPSLFKNGTDYFWRVRGKTSKGDGDYSPIYTFTIFIAPKGPELIQPVDYATLKTTDINFVWNKSKGLIKNYRFELWEQFGDDPLIADSTIQDTFKTVKNLKFNQVYTWKVAARGQDYWGEFSAEYKFEIIDVPGKIALATPIDNFESFSKSIKFDWTAPSSGTVTKYRLEISKDDKTFKSFYLVDSALKFTNRTVNNIAQGTFYWRVTGGNDNGWGITGDPRTFKITPAGIEFDNDDLSISVYPNPSNSIITVNSIESDINSIQVCDILGNLILNEANLNFLRLPKYHDTNIDIMNLDLSSLPQGQYMLLIKTDKNTFMKKITLIK